MHDLRTIRKEKRKEEVGFESQKSRETEDARKKELNDARVRLTNSRAAATELATEYTGAMQAPIPGNVNVNVPFEDLAAVVRTVLHDVNKKYAEELA